MGLPVTVEKRAENQTVPGTKDEEWALIQQSVKFS